MKIALMAGHGGWNTDWNIIDPGACNGNFKEHYVAKDILVEVAKLIEGKIQYVLTKPNDDTKLCTEEALQKGCDYAVCLHHNSATNPNATWTEGYYYQTESNKKWTQSLVNNLSTMFPPNNGVKNYWGVQGQKYRANYLPNTIPYYAFLELGFISNDGDVVKLTQRKTDVAKLIVKSIEEFSGIKILGATQLKILLNTQGADKDYALVNNLKVRLPLHLVCIKESYLIDLRFICDTFGAKIEWYPNTKEIVIKLNSTVIKLSMEGTNRQNIIVNGVSKKMPLSLVAIFDRNYINLRSIVEALGGKIDWLANTKQIVVTK